MSRLSWNSVRGGVRISLLGAALLGIACGSSPKDSTANGGGSNATLAGAPGSSGALGGSTEAGASSAAGSSSVAGSSNAAGSSNVGGLSGLAGALTSGGTAGSGGVPGTGGGATGGAAGSPAGTVCVAKTAVASMKLGWNLGNSLDAADPSKSDTAVETAWGNPLVTPELMKRGGIGWFRRSPHPGDLDRALRCGSELHHQCYIHQPRRPGREVRVRCRPVRNHQHSPRRRPQRDGRWLSLVDSCRASHAANNSAVSTQFKALWTQIAARFSAMVST